VICHGLVILFALQQLSCCSFSKNDIYWYVLSSEASCNAITAEIADRCQSAIAFGAYPYFAKLSNVVWN